MRESPAILTWLRPRHTRFVYRRWPALCRPSASGDGPAPACAIRLSPPWRLRAVLASLPAVQLAEIFDPDA